MMRPGMERTWAWRVAKKAAWGSTEAEGHAKTLGRAEGDVGTQLRRGDLRSTSASKSEATATHSALSLQCGDRCRDIADFAAFVGVLQQGAEDFVAGCIGGWADDQFKAEIGGTGAHHVEGLREDAFIHEEGLALHLGDAAGHGHGFGGSGGFVEQGGVGELQTGEVDDHLLEVQ